MKACQVRSADVVPGDRSGYRGRGTNRRPVQAQTVTYEKYEILAAEYSRGEALCIRAAVQWKQVLSSLWRNYGCELLPADTVLSLALSFRYWHAAMRKVARNRRNGVICPVFLKMHPYYYEFSGKLNEPDDG